MERAAVVTAPLRSPELRHLTKTWSTTVPITRAGQHQAPIRAGMDASNVTMEMIS